MLSYFDTGDVLKLAHKAKELALQLEADKHLDNEGLLEVQIYQLADAILSKIDSCPWVDERDYREFKDEAIIDTLESEDPWANDFKPR